MDRRRSLWIPGAIAVFSLASIFFASSNYQQLAAASTGVQCASAKGVPPNAATCENGCSYTLTPNSSKAGTFDITATVSDPTGKQPGVVKYEDGNGGTIIRLCNGTVASSLPSPSSQSVATAPEQDVTITPDNEPPLQEAGPSQGTGSALVAPSTHVDTDDVGTGAGNATGGQLSSAADTAGGIANAPDSGALDEEVSALSPTQINTATPVSYIPSSGYLNTQSNSSLAEDTFPTNEAASPLTLALNGSGTQASGPQAAPAGMSVPQMNQAIGSIAQQTMLDDNRINSVALQYNGFASNGQLDQPLYVGVDDSLTVAQSLNAAAREYAAEDVAQAVGQVTHTDPNVVDDPGSVTASAVVIGGGVGQSTLLFDPTNGSLLMTSDGTNPPTLYTSSGTAVPTSYQTGSWISTLQQQIQTPGELQTFENAYLGTADPAFAPDAHKTVDVLDSDGNQTVQLSAKAFSALQSEENVVYGIDAAAGRIADMTNGKVTLNISGLPQAAGFAGDDLSPANALTPLPAAQRSQEADTIEGEIEKYPAVYWKLANSVTIYDFGQLPGDAGSAVQSGGVSMNDEKQIWINGSDQDVALTVDHELTHYNDDVTLPSDPRFARQVYGSYYPSAYAGTNGADAIVSGKLDGVTGTIAGFVEPYGSYGGIQEDKATIVGAMFNNYAAVQQAMQNDPILALKVQILQNSFSRATGGAMGPTFWQNLEPIDPDYKVPAITSHR